MRSKLIVALLVSALALGAASSVATGSTSRQASVGAVAGPSLASSCFLAKTKFALHAGLAFGAFHRYIYKPYRAHAFTGPDKVKTIAKAAVAGAFVYHEVNIALQDAKCSKTLSVVVSPLTALGAGFTGLVAKLKGGSVDGAGLASLGKGVDSVGSLAGGAGVPITDIAHGL
jgi:hypothetical protein